MKVNVKVTTAGKSEQGLASFRPHTLANELFDLVVDDLRLLSRRPELARLVSQQLSSADSIAANIEEGYGRGSKRDYAHFLVIARGSAQETLGRYRRLHHWLPSETVNHRVTICCEIIAILTASIRTLRAATRPT
jgi:four helix bundle protein